MKIAIVGADLRAWAKIPDGEMKVKKRIFDILMGIPSGRWTKNNARKAFLDEKEITVVSGHCSVGEERWYCVDCHVWKYCAPATHRRIKVYDQGGVDTWAEIIATELGLKKEIYPAEINQLNYKKEYHSGFVGNLGDMNPIGSLPFPRVQQLGIGSWKTLKGYRSRNIQIAKVCDVIYDIEPAGSCTGRGGCNGTGWILSKTWAEDAKDSRIPCPKCDGDGAYSGGTWTMREAERLGKKVHKVII